MAIMLKLDVLKLPKNATLGVGGVPNVTHYDTVQIDLGHGIVFSAYVGFTEGLESVGLGLLGQAGFFDKYDVHFSHNQKLFTIEPCLEAVTNPSKRKKAFRPLPFPPAKMPEPAGQILADHPAESAE
jgi:hypothetical protein